MRQPIPKPPPKEKRAKKYLRRSPVKRSGKAIPKQGKRGKLWADTRKKLKKEFQHKQIERCELYGSEFGRGFAHRFKRRFITTLEELKIVVLLCNEPCHRTVERMKHHEMKEFLDKLIAGRLDRYFEPC